MYVYTHTREHVLFIAPHVIHKDSCDMVSDMLIKPVKPSLSYTYNGKLAILLAQSGITSPLFAHPRAPASCNRVYNCWSVSTNAFQAQDSQLKFAPICSPVRPVRQV